jgi:hypothetical protein
MCFPHRLSQPGEGGAVHRPTEGPQCERERQPVPPAAQLRGAGVVDGLAVPQAGGGPRDVQPPLPFARQLRGLHKSDRCADSAHEHADAGAPNPTGGISTSLQEVKSMPFPRNLYLKLQLKSALAVLHGSMRTDARHSGGLPCMMLRRTHAVARIDESAFSVQV